MKLRAALARNVGRVRRSRGLSQEALAASAGLDRTYISAIERSKYSITIDVLEKLSAALDVDPRDLLTDAG